MVLLIETFDLVLIISALVALTVGALIFFSIGIYHVKKDHAIIIEKIKEHKGFSHKVKGFYYSESVEGENMFSFKCQNFPAPVKINILFQPFTQKFLHTLNSDEDGHCLIFRLVMTNTRSEPTLKINYEEKS